MRPQTIGLINTYLLIIYKVEYLTISTISNYCVVYSSPISVLFMPQ